MNTCPTLLIDKLINTKISGATATNVAAYLFREDAPQLYQR